MLVGGIETKASPSAWLWLRARQKFQNKVIFGSSEGHATIGATQVGHYFHCKNITALFWEYNHAPLGI